MRFEILMAMTVKIVFWDVTLYSPIFTYISEEPDVSIFRVEYYSLDRGFFVVFLGLSMELKDKNSD
jgi:hypothetical protein